jgi:uncharacterized protein
VHFVYCLIDGENAADLRRDHEESENAYLAAVNDRIFFGGTLLSEDRTEAKGSLYVIDWPDRAAAEAWLTESPYRNAGVYREARMRGYTHMVPKGGLADSVNHGLWAYVQIDVPHSLSLRKVHIDAHIDFLNNTADDIYSDGPLYWDSDKAEFEDRIGSVFVVDFPTLAAAEKWRLSEPFTVEGVYGTLYAYAYDNHWPAT